MTPKAPKKATRPRLAIVATLLVTLGLSLAGAAEAVSSFAALDERIDLGLEHASAEQVLTVFAQIFQAELKLDPAVEGEVTITLFNVTARTALNAVCEGLGCHWRLVAEGKPRLVVEPEPPEGGQSGKAKKDTGADTTVTLETDETPAVDVLGALAKLHGIHLTLDPQLEGTVTASLRDRPLSEILDQICEQVGCRWSLTTEADHQLLRVSSLTPRN